MKIGIDARMLGPKQTGIGEYIKYLIEGVKKKKEGNNFVLFLRPEQMDKVVLGEIEKIEAPSRWYSWGEQTRFLKKLKKQDCDLVHFPHFSHPILYREPFVVTVHDLTPLYYPGQGTPFYRKLAYRLVLRSACKHAKKVITPSRFTKKDILKHFDLPADKIEVIPEGIRFEPQLKEVLNSSYSDYKKKTSRELSKTYPALASDEYIFYTGVWRYHKNISGLVEAFQILIDNFDFNGKLVLGGGPKEKDNKRVKSMIKTKGLEERILTPGFLSEEKLRLFYRGASVFVLPSFYEGFGLGPLEASSQATPVCCSRIGPLPEVMGESALYFDPREPKDIASKINKIFSDQQLVRNLLFKSKENLDRFSWKRMAADIVELYLMGQREKEF